METDIIAKIEETQKKIEEVRLSVEKMRKYFLWTLIISLGLIIIPLIGLAFAIPKFLGLYSNIGL